MTKKISKPRVSKPFSTGIAEIDALYHEINEEMVAASVLKPLIYHFDEQSQNHILTYAHQIRFVKNNNSRAVIVENFSNGKWVEEGPEIGQDKYVLSSTNIFSPLMWPVSKTNASFDRTMPSAISLYDKKSYDLFNSRPDLFKDEANKKKLMQAGLVLRSKWNTKAKRFRAANLRSGVHKWWTVFVDRDVFKACVGVEGRTSASRVSWVDYARLSALPNCQEIITHIASLGPEKRMLDIARPHQWLDQDQNKLVPDKWAKIWPEVKKEPYSVQEVVFNRAVFNRAISSQYATGHVFNDPFAKKEDLKEEKNSNSFSQNAPDEWSVFKAVLEKFPNPPPRQKLLLFHAAEAFVSVKKRRFRTQGKEDYQEFLDKCIDWLPDILDIWKETHKKEYRHWNMTAKSHWIFFVENAFLSSDHHGKLCFSKFNPDPWTSEEFNNYQRLWQKKLLTREIGSKEVPVAKKRM